MRSSWPPAGRTGSKTFRTTSSCGLCSTGPRAARSKPRAARCLFLAPVLWPRIGPVRRGRRADSAHEHFVDRVEHQEILDHIGRKAFARIALGDQQIIEVERTGFGAPDGYELLRDVGKLLLERRFGKAIGLRRR